MAHIVGQYVYELGCCCCTAF